MGRLACSDAPKINCSTPVVKYPKENMPRYSAGKQDLHFCDAKCAVIHLYVLPHGLMGTSVAVPHTFSLVWKGTIASVRM